MAARCQWVFAVTALVTALQPYLAAPVSAWLAAWVRLHLPLP